MSTIEISTPDGKTLQLDAPDGATPDQIHSAALAASKHYQSQNQPSSLKSNVSAFARPMLQGLGAVGGGVLGSAGGPPGAVGGGILGFGIGNESANILDQKLGLKKSPQNLGEAAKQTGQDLYEGAQNEATGLAMAPVLKGIGEFGKPLLSTMSGVPASDFKVLANKPSTILPSTMETAATNLSKAREAFGVAQTGKAADLAAVDLALREDKPYINALKEKLDSGIKLTPREIVEGNQATNNLLKKEKNKSAKRGFQILKDQFESLMTPDVLASNKEYSEAKSGANFRKILPITKSGDPAIVRTLYMLSKLAGPQALLSIPALNAPPTILGGMMMKFANNAPMRRAVTPPLLQALQSLVEQIRPDENK